MRRLVTAAMTALLIVGLLPAQAFADSQTIVWGQPTPVGAVVGGSYTPAPTASSGLTPVDLAVGPSTTNSACSISGGVVSFVHVGTCDVMATQAGGVNNGITYTAVTDDQVFTIGQGSQTIGITSTAPASPVVGGTYTVVASATSGLTATITIDTSTTNGACSVVGALVTFDHVGTCVIDANQSGDADWLAASPQAQQSLVVGQATQTISFTSSASGQVVGVPYTVSATGGGSGNPVTFTIDAGSAGNCTIAGSTVTFVHAALCTIDANQTGNADYLDAPQQQLAVTAGKGTQTVTFTTTPTSPVVGGTYQPQATGGASGNGITYAIDPATSGQCSVTTGTVNLNHAGACTVVADQAGNGDYNAGTNSQAFTIGKGSQSISFTSTAPVGSTILSSAYTVTATATSGLAVAFTVDGSSAGACTITGADTVNLVHAGTCVIDANQAGSADWNPAAQRQQSFTIGKASQTVSFGTTAPASAVVAGPGYTPAVTATSGLAVSIGVDPSSAGVCAISGGTVTFQAAGLCTLDATQAGNGDYTSAGTTQAFSVGKGSQTVSITSTAPAGATVLTPAYTVAASASSGLAVALSIDASANGACTIAGSVVTIAHAGTCVIDANQAGTADWIAATQVQQSFAIGKADQTVSFTTPAPSSVSIGDHFTPTAQATSGLPVAITISPSSAAVCTIDGANQVTFTSAASPGCIIDAAQGGDTDWNAAVTVTMTIGVGDHVPVCSPTTPVGTPMNRPVGGVANCVDPDPQVLTYSIGTNGTKGTAAINPATGAWTYTPALNATGSDTFTVVANDTVLNSDPAPVQVTITNYFAPRNDAFTILPILPARLDVLANDAVLLPSQASSGEPLAITAITQGQLGRVSVLPGGLIQYTPTSCATGVDQFTYSVTDGVSPSIQKSVFVTIGRPGDPDGNGGTLPPAPTVSGPSVSLINGSTVGLGSAPVRLGWCAVAGAATSLQSYLLAQSGNGGLAFSGAGTTTTPSAVVGTGAAYTYQWAVRAYDRAGRSSLWGYSPVLRVIRTESSSSAMRYAGVWSTVGSSAYSGGSERYARSTSSVAAYRTASSASMFGIVGSRATARGYFRVYVDNVQVAVVSERAASTQNRRVLYVGALTPGRSHVITIRPYGNGRVDLDAILTIQ